MCLYREESQNWGPTHQSDPKHNPTATPHGNAAGSAQRELRPRGCRPSITRQEKSALRPCRLREPRDARRLLTKSVGKITAGPQRPSGAVGARGGAAEPSRTQTLRVSKLSHTSVKRHKRSATPVYCHGKRRGKAAAPPAEPRRLRVAVLSPTSPHTQPRAEPGSAAAAPERDEQREASGAALRAELCRAVL